MSFGRDASRTWHVVVEAQGRTATTKCSATPISMLVICPDPKKVEYVKPVMCEACERAPEPAKEEPPPPPPEEPPRAPSPAPVSAPVARRRGRPRKVVAPSVEVSQETPEATATPGSGEDEEEPAADIPEEQAPGGRSLRLGKIFAGRWLDEENPPPAPKPLGAPRKYNPLPPVIQDDPPWIKLGITRDQWRSRRHHLVRATSINTKRLSQASLAATAEDYPEEVDRPLIRAECENGERPCPFVSCAHHLYLDVNRRTGSIKLNFPDREVEELAVSCALDVADEGGATLERVAEAMNLTRERVRQIEFSMKRRLGPRFEALRRDVLEK